MTRIAAALALALVAGCGTDPGQTMQSSSGDPATLSALQAEVAMLSAQVSMLSAQVAQLQKVGATEPGDGGAASPGTVPYLVDSSGNTLGRWMEGACYWSDSLAGEVCLGASAQDLYFPQAGCVGAPMLLSLPVFASQLITHAGEAYRVGAGAAPAQTAVASRLRGTDCTDEPDGNMGTVFQLEDVGAVAAPSTAGMLRIEYR